MMIRSIAGDSRVKRLGDRLALREGTVSVSGVWGSSARMVTALSGGDSDRVYLYVTAHLEQADNACDDLELFWQRPCEVFPAFETLQGEGASDGEIEAERLRVCTQLLGLRDHDWATGGPKILIAPVQALMQILPTAEQIAEHTVCLSLTGQTVDHTSYSPQTLLAWAIDHGFERLPLVESPGDVALRGDILDLFAPGETHPYRIQFEDDVIESLRRFDVGSQRSIESLPEIRVTVMPVSVDDNSSSGKIRPVTDLFDYLPGDALIVLDEPIEIQTLGETLEKRIGESNSLFTVADLFQRIAEFPQLHLGVFEAAVTQGDSVFELGVVSVSRFESNAREAVRELGKLASDHEIHVVSDTKGEQERLIQMIQEEAPEAVSSIQLHAGVMHRGFEWTATKTIVVSHHELFHRHRLRRRVRRIQAGRPIDSWLDLKSGEHVVHVVHGIGVFRGLKKMNKGDSKQQEEFLAVEFAGQSFIYVPTSQIDLLQQYIGMAGKKPELSKIGGKRWARTKQQVADSVSELAESMLRIQALRENMGGVAYPDDTEWQREFEASFPYEETEDQLTVASEIRSDLIRQRPMDRLVCGDVGYGKTELAMRAAFKVMEYGRQVAILVPTTVLAEQHYRTFRERMAEYPFTVECLSRFRNAAEQKKIVEDLKKGRVDIVIGTHRLISKDVKFANLGLVVIDEEQRFGVAHKEKLKNMRETVDVLTLTATPIPRTLHMALMGIRDISSLQTPPVDRRSIATQVRPFSRDLIRSAILREMNRDGQVFFVHNFVQSIVAMADTIKSIVPEARVIFAHGQMKGRELEAVMQRFVRRESDVLVCTTIIESGIDIPSVNTIFINRAERFGLADLHQLRGRVGRSDHRAYCYLLLSPKHPPTGKASKRLKTIEEFSELGAGFRIAMRDLEIRGAGNLLGSEQSGHIAAVGYEMYCQLVEQAVRRLKNEPDPTPSKVHIDLNIAAHIPRTYIVADRSRMEIYRRIASTKSQAELLQLEHDITDAFGAYPSQVDCLLDLTQLRISARSLKIRSISLRPPDVIFITDQMSMTEPLFEEAAGSVRIPDQKTIHWRPPANYLEPATLLPILRKMFGRVGTRTKAKTKAKA